MTAAFLATFQLSFHSFMDPCAPSRRQVDTLGHPVTPGIAPMLCLGALLGPLPSWWAPTQRPKVRPTARSRGSLGVLTLRRGGGPRAGSLMKTRLVDSGSECLPGCLATGPPGYCIGMVTRDCVVMAHLAAAAGGTPAPWICCRKSLPPFSTA
ncbi:hypothetical protein GE09DRAFT_725955 [Coniochaeta sp. 2T2.1]|nr:hypothetical protein GE09DRAFT_725955 [Coniochaeta sp. 2T2.1]